MVLEKDVLREKLKEINPILKKAIINSGLDLPMKKIGNYDGELNQDDQIRLTNRRRRYAEVRDILLNLRNRYCLSQTEYEQANKYVVDSLGI